MPGVSIVSAGSAPTAVAAAALNASSAGSSIANTKPGLVQNCPAPKVSDAAKDLAIAAPRSAKAPGSKTDRIDAAHLGIDRDRLVALCGEAHQRQPAAARSGEADRLDARIGYQRLADRIAGAVEQGEDAFGQVACHRRVADRLPDQRRGAGMRRMRLGDDGAAGGKRGGGVAPGDRESEREV